MLGKPDLALIVVLLFSPSATLAAERNPGQDNADTLYKNCGGGANKWSESYCFRYVVGVLESAKKDGRPLPACQPKGVTNGQVVDAVRDWLSSRPEERQKSAASLIAKAIAETWPCK